MLQAGIDVFSTVNVQHLESLNDQVCELTGVTVRETVPGLGARHRRRGGADRPHPRGPDRAPARRQGLPGPEHPGGARQLLPDREPRRAPRDGRCARSPRGRVQAPGRRDRRSARGTRGARRGRRAEGRRRADPGPDPAAAQLAAAGPSRMALGAAVGHRPRPALGQAAAGADDRAQGEAAARRCGSSHRCSGRRCWSRRSDDVVDATAEVVRRARAPPTSSSGSPTRRAGWRGCASRCHSA